MTAPTTPAVALPEAVEEAIIALATAGMRYGAAEELASSAEAHGLDGYPFWDAVDDAVEARNAADDALRAAILAYGDQRAASVEARPVTSARAAGVLAAIDRAADMVDALCMGKRRWLMSVPVQDDDPDIVISDALRLARAALATEREAGHAEALAAVDAAAERLAAVPMDWRWDHQRGGFCAAILAAAAALDATREDTP